MSFATILRVSASITGTDPAIGAVLDGSGRRRSRFGLDDRAAIAAALAEKALGSNERISIGIIGIAFDLLFRSVEDRRFAWRGLER